MGEISDYYINRMLDLGYGPYGKNKTAKPVCNQCGSKTVHWRIFGGSYKLADDQRGPSNKYAQHYCPTSADGFEDCSDEHQPQGKKK